MVNFKPLNLLTIGVTAIGAAIVLQSPMMAQSTSDYHQGWSDHYNDTADWYDYHGDTNQSDYWRRGAETEQGNSNYYGGY